MSKPNQADPRYNIVGTSTKCSTSLSHSVLGHGQASPFRPLPPRLQLGAGGSMLDNKARPTRKPRIRPVTVLSSNGGHVVSCTSRRHSAPVDSPNRNNKIASSPFISPFMDSPMIRSLDHEDLISPPLSPKLPASSPGPCCLLDIKLAILNKSTNLKHGGLRRKEASEGANSLSDSTPRLSNTPAVRLPPTLALLDIKLAQREEIDQQYTLSNAAKEYVSDDKKGTEDPKEIFLVGGFDCFVPPAPPSLHPRPKFYCASGASDTRKEIASFPSALHSMNHTPRDIALVDVSKMDESLLDNDCIQGYDNDFIFGFPQESQSDKTNRGCDSIDKEARSHSTKQLKTTPFSMPPLLRFSSGTSMASVDSLEFEALCPIPMHPKTSALPMPPLVHFTSALSMASGKSLDGLNIASDGHCCGQDAALRYLPIRKNQSELSLNSLGLSVDSGADADYSIGDTQYRDFSTPIITSSSDSDSQELSPPLLQPKRYTKHWYSKIG